MNLRPKKERSSELARPAAACLNATHPTRGSRTDLQARWALLVQAGQSGRWPGLTLTDTQIFTGWLEQAGFRLYIIPRSTATPTARLTNCW